MRIYVYITRRDSPIEDGLGIGEKEWLAAISNDPSFRQPGKAEIDKAPRVRKSHYSVWTGHPEGFEAWFIWTDGQIDIRNPDEAIVAKAMEIAPKLGARVISEMGEIFNEDGSHKGFVDGAPR